MHRNAPRQARRSTVSSLQERNDSLAEGPDAATVGAFQRLVGEVFRLNGELLAAGERFGADLGVTPARWQAIAVLRREGMTVPELARRLGLSRQSVQRTVNRLVADGIAAQKPNPGHRRSPRVTLTRRGRQLMETLGERQALLTGEFIARGGLGADDFERLAAALRALREGWPQDRG